MPSAEFEPIIPAGDRPQTPLFKLIYKNNYPWESEHEDEDWIELAEGCIKWWDI